jgi:hypothetical protein
MMLIAVGFGIIAGAGLAAGLAFVGHFFHGPGQRFWGGFIAVVGGGLILYGAWYMVSRRYVETTCTVVDSEVVQIGTKTWRAMGRVKWRAGGSTYTMRRGPLDWLDTQAGADEAVAHRVQPGAVIPCTYRANNTRHIYLEPSPGLGGGAGALGSLAMSAGAFMVVAGFWYRRRFPRSRRTRLGGLVGLPGAIGAMTAFAGWLVYEPRPTVAVLLLVGGGLVLVGTATYEVIVSRRVLKRVRLRVAIDSSQPQARNAIAGYWDGLWRVRVVVRWHAAQVHVELPGWPVGLQVSAPPAGQEGNAHTGDPVFDKRIVLDGDDAIWRPLLTATVRAAVVELLVDHHGSVNSRSKELVVRLLEVDVDELERIVDLAVDMAREIHGRPNEPLPLPPASLVPPDDAHPEPRVLELARQEAVAAVRDGHYRWLVGRSWKLPDVLRQAAQDEDGDIAAWARNQLPPEEGPYR